MDLFLKSWADQEYFAHTLSQFHFPCHNDPLRYFSLDCTLRKISHRCSRNFCRHFKKVTDWLFAFAFCKKCTRETGVLARWLFTFVFKDLCTENRGKLPRKILRQRKNRNFSILNSSAPSQNNKTSRTSCRRLFENFLPSTPTEKAFEISVIWQEVKCDCADCFIFI